MRRIRIGAAVCSLVFPLQAGYPPFPANPGVRWTYELEGRFALQNQGAVCGTYKGRWVMEILQSRRVQGLIQLQVKGSVFHVPSPFEWEANPPSPALGSLVLDQDGRLYELDGDPEGIWKLGGESLRTLLNEESVVFQWPAQIGTAWAVMDRAREDGMYQWRVDGEEPAPPSVRGWAKLVGGIRVCYRTNPDHQIYNFVPGLGVTRFEYVHHGTTGEFTARLLLVEGLESSNRKANP